MTTYKEFRLEHGLSKPHYSFVDEYTLDNPEDFSKLFLYLFADTDWSAISALLKHPASEAFLETGSGINWNFFQNLKNPEHFSEENFLILADTEKLSLNSHESYLCLLYLRFGLSHIKILLQVMPALDEMQLKNVVDAQTRALLWAARYGYSELLEYLLRQAPVYKQIGANNNLALRMASENGHIACVAHLLNLPAILSQAGVLDNWALCLAHKNGHSKVVNRLLQEPNVRANKLPKQEGQAYNLILIGLKRALWLDLQQTKGFEEINSLADLQALASGYLRDHPEWLHASFNNTAREALIKNTRLQVLGLGYYKPFMSFNLLLAEHWELAEDFIFMALPQTLAHFQEAQFIQAKSLAYRCLRTRQEAEHAPQAPNPAPLALTTAITRRLS